MIEALLPAAASCSERFGPAQPEPLYPEEEALVARAVDKRRREFSCARARAREALARLGVAPAPLLRGEKGEPAWPAGIVGSITHCAGYCGAAVARAGEVVSLGIDAEPHDALPDGVLRSISSDAERAHLEELRRGDPHIHWDRLLFCAKESVYKTWFPLARRWLGFEDAEVSFAPAPGGRGGTLRARLLVPGPPVNGAPLAELAGRWSAEGGIVAAAIAVPFGTRAAAAQ
jgi:4'-phosphopantetheinyl transferase EntD